MAEGRRGRRERVTADAQAAALRRARAHERGLVPPPGSEGRSRNQRAIKRSDTKPEVRLRSELHARGLRFRKDYRLVLADGTKARPDVVFTRAKVAVFYDSCFWHACPSHGRRPAVNEWYWTPKLARTVERDAQTTAALRASGWIVIRMWEHEDLHEAVERISTSVGSRRHHPRPTSTSWVGAPATNLEVSPEPPLGPLGCSTEPPTLGGHVPAESILEQYRIHDFIAWRRERS
jgi:DNA mismatch endonuclease (patch repair protein)